jgi:hypothetical protein
MEAATAGPSSGSPSEPVNEVLLLCIQEILVSAWSPFMDITYA